LDETGYVPLKKDQQMTQPFTVFKFYYFHILSFRGNIIGVTFLSSKWSLRTSGSGRFGNFVVSFVLAKNFLRSRALRTKQGNESRT